MFVTRRSLIRGAMGLAAGPLLCVPRAAIAAAPTTLALVPVADGLFVAQGRQELFTPDNGGHIANLSVVIGDDALAVIDTGGSVGVGRALLAAIRAVSDKPVRYVVNTHMHPDHVLGNAAFAEPGTIFVGHHKLPRALGARGERYLSANKDQIGIASFDGTRIIPPTLLVETSLTLDLGNRPLTLVAHGTSHTDNDLTARDSKTETLVLGDLLFSGHIPALDGSIKGWLAVIGELKQQPASRAVPGHGPASMVWPQALDDETRYLSVLANDVRACIKAGQSIEEATRTAGRSERGKWLLFDDFHARNVSAAYAELEWE